MESRSASPVEGCAFPKISLVGNPSDGYGGATLGLTAANFSATVTAYSSDAMAFGDEGDDFPSEAEAAHHRALYGDDDATRLLGATWQVFEAHAEHLGIRLIGACTLSARTTIPRQLGLGGSSAIVAASLSALCRFHGIALEPRSRVSLGMRVENEVLGIRAGLMDRVVQVMDGLIHLDCAREWSMTRLDPEALPPLYLAWRPDYAKRSSGATLGPLAQRFEAGEPDVVAAMRELATLSRRARDALLANDRAAFCRLLDAGIDLRLRLLPDTDARYRRLIEIGRAAGSHVTFPGSGGAVVGTYEDDAHLKQIERAYGEAGLTVEAIAPTIV